MSPFRKKEKKSEDLEIPLPFPETDEIKEEMRKKHVEKNIEFPRYNPVTLSEEEEPIDITSTYNKSEPKMSREDDLFGDEVHPKGQSLFIKIEKYNGFLDR